MPGADGSEVPDGRAAVDVSVVVATRNRAGFLVDALRSLAAQECDARYEVVVVDNASTDTTPDAIREWSRRDARIRSVVEPTVGLSRAKNTGIRVAQGRLILFTDDDVVLEEGWISAYVRFFSQGHDSMTIAGGPVLPIPADLAEWPSWVQPGARPDLPSLFYGDLERPLAKFEWLWGANMAVPKDLFAALGRFQETFGRGAEPDTFEDVELVERLRKAGGSAWYCPDTAVHHRVDPMKARPRVMLLNAFHRGCSDRAKDRLGIYYEPAGRVPAGRLTAGFALPAVLGGLACWTALFRLTGRPRAFDRARRTSWRAGWCMWAISGESSRRRARVVRLLVRTARQLAVRVTPA
jgi:GT2 family glycosyltransferase